VFIAHRVLSYAIIKCVPGLAVVDLHQTAPPVRVIWINLFERLAPGHRVIGHLLHAAARAQFAQQWHLPFASSSWPMMRQPHCAHTGPSFRIAQSHESNTCVLPSITT
jgi:hypothetical protein